MANDTRPHQWIADHKDYPHDYCLIWPFAREGRVGRGMMGHAGKNAWAHRVMCEAVKGPAPIDKPQAAHSCGNGDQGCVNPRHLYWATNSQNQLERYRHGRGNRNANGNKSMFTPAQIAKIRSQYGEFTQTKLAEMYECSLGTIQYYLKYRDERGHAGGKIEHWSPEQDDLLRLSFERAASLKKAARIRTASQIIGRSEGAIRSRAYRLNLIVPKRRAA